MPIDESVAEIFEAIIPLLPTPQIITFDLHLIIAFTALSKVSFIEFLSFFNARICNSITSLPISYFNGTKYHP